MEWYSRVIVWLIPVLQGWLEVSQEACKGQRKRQTTNRASERRAEEVEMWRVDRATRAGEKCLASLAVASIVVMRCPKAKRR